MAKKKLKVGFDLDGVIVDKPFFMPKSVIEWLYRTHNGNHKKYRVPTWQLEILIRKLSHHWLLRLPLRKNLKKIKKIFKQTDFEIYFISGRFNFLNNRTKNWFKRYFPEFPLNRVFINKNNEQPHLFKEKTLKKLNIDHFYDDSLITTDYLEQKLQQTKITRVDKEELPPVR